MVLLNCCTRYISKLENSAVVTGLEKVSFSFHCQRRAMKRNVQTTIRLHSFHMLAKLRSKSFKLGFSTTWTENFQMYKLGFEEAEEPEIKLPTFVWSWRKQGNSRKISTSASLTMLKSLTVWITINYGKVLKRWVKQSTLPISWETYMWVKKQVRIKYVKPVSELGKEYITAVYCHPAH